MFDEFGFPRGADLDVAAPSLYTFVYCSRAAEGVDDAEVGRIVESAQRRNLARGITGVLVDLLPRIHAIGKLARQMETSDATRSIYRRADHWGSARA
jgi:Sensors of blue-light using FAD